MGRWESFRIRQTDPICQQWLILHKVDNNDQMRCERLRDTGSVRTHMIGVPCRFWTRQHPSQHL